MHITIPRCWSTLSSQVESVGGSKRKIEATTCAELMYMHPADLHAPCHDKQSHRHGLPVIIGISRMQLHPRLLATPSCAVRFYAILVSEVSAVGLCMCLQIFKGNPPAGSSHPTFFLICSETFLGTFKAFLAQILW